HFGVYNPFDPAQNVDAGVRYLSMLLDRYNGNLPKALAAYNAGPSAVDRWGGVPDYRETREYVRKETRSYTQAASEPKPARGPHSLRESEALVLAYGRVYLITPSAVQVPPAIKQVADLYRRMGEQFEPKYFNDAIETYEFLIHDYPESSLREPTLFAIAEIRKD